MNSDYFGFFFQNKVSLPLGLRAVYLQFYPMLVIAVFCPASVSIMLDLVSLFLLYQISNVIHESRALDMKTNVVFPLGETASAIRGENVLWLAMVLRNRVLLDLNPAQLAAVCGSLVSEGIKVRPWKNNRYSNLLISQIFFFIIIYCICICFHLQALDT